ncbi:MAG: hypothetical protein Q8Q65_01600, partial [bacterium]|nr:hypothetical protein [bacterium]
MLIKECDGVLKASQVDLGSAGSHSIQLYIKDPVHHDDRVLGAAGCCALDNSKHGIIYRTSDTKSQVAAG